MRTPGGIEDPIHGPNLPAVAAHRPPDRSDLKAETIFCKSCTSKTMLGVREILKRAGIEEPVFSCMIVLLSMW